ncbi:MAG TPA: uroporphyrinogen decarboxylase family protein [Draconibacterium sp.]|nr:uroporphyrinogen decarboxylase family protein [Draconibacterium sp.]
MNSRERVIAVFENKPADRPPCWCGASAEFWQKAKNETGLGDEELLQRLGDDFRRVFAEYTGPVVPLKYKNATYRTVFGVERDGLGYGQPLHHPLADAGLTEINEYSWPSPEWMDVSKIKREAQKYEGQYAILGGDWSPFWHDAIDLLGMENLLIKMCNEPELVELVFEKIVDYYFKVNQRIFEEASDIIDIFFIGNDFGGQNGPLIGPEMFEQFIYPHLKRLIDLGHNYGLKVQMHCCGGFYELFPLMIDAGLDALHALQPDCRGMDLSSLKREFGGKIVLNGGIDSKKILINGSVEYVKEQTGKVLDIMTPGGNYIAGASHDSILEETPVENVLAMFDEITSYKT